MRKTTKPDQDRYFAQGASWAQDRRDALTTSRRIAWIIAGIAVVIALCEALALVILMPLKTVVPYTLMVDRQTGFVQALKPLDTQLVSGDRALTQSFLVQYVIAREGFDYDTLQADYRKVGLWSTGRARADYVNGMQASDPDSPLARLPRSTVIDVQVKSVTPLSANSAMVRYDTQRRDAGGQVQTPQSWVAAVHYGYSGEPASIADRFVNPLGFQVQRYRRSQEVLPTPQPPSATSQVPGGAVSGLVTPPRAVLP
jgi:type IV secretion system protein VirB8